MERIEWQTVMIEGARKKSKAQRERRLGYEVKKMIIALRAPQNPQPHLLDA